MEKSITMFAGKGGVGKTTMAAATALSFSLQGKKTIIISTDATPSLADIFEKDRGAEKIKINDNLFAQELGLEQVMEMWQQKFGHEVYQVFSAFVDLDYDIFVDFMTSMLPGLNEEFMLYYINELKNRSEYEYIVWDTAPLGQTLALLGTPAMLVEHLKLAPRIYSRLKLGQGSQKPVLDILKGWEDLSSQTIKFLRGEVDINLVTIPEALAVNQLERIVGELNRYQLSITRLIINNVARGNSSEFLRLKSEQQKPYIEKVKKSFAHLEIIEVPLYPQEVKGTKKLEEIARILSATNSGLPAL